MNIGRSRRIRHIVVHSTATRRMLVNDMDKLPYHFLVTRGGKLLNLKPRAVTDSTIEVAWLGGLDRRGRHVDNRTEQQNETLFNTLVLLSERYGEAHIVAADELYVYAHANPGFDLKEWLAAYIPAFLEAA